MEDLSQDRPRPRLDADSDRYWSAAASGILLLQRCAACETPRFYPRLLCPACHSDEHRWEAATGRGSVYSFSVVHRAPSPALQAETPYVVALVDLDDGVRMFASIWSPPDAIRIGSRVSVAFRRLGDELALPGFELDQTGAPS